MLDVLQRQHEVKARYSALGSGEKDAMPEVARSLAAEGRVLCFDEFQVRLLRQGGADDRSRI
jgi:protein AFG1